MTTSSFTDFFDSTTDAGFRSWGGKISAALAAVGMVQTADTGQINWTTVASPTVNGAETIGGYEVWRLSDTLQATRPLFMKFEYGAYSRSGVSTKGGQPVLYITVGTGSNGSGTLTGLVTTRSRVLGNSGTGTTGTAPAAPTTNIPCYFSGDGGYLTMALGVSPTSPYTIAMSSSSSSSTFPALYMLERTHDSVGASTSDGAVVWFGSYISTAGSSASSPVHRTTYFSFTLNSLVTFTSAVPFGFPGTGYSTGAVGSNLYTWPFVVATPAAQPQALGVLGVYVGDITSGSTVTVNVLGSNHTYLSAATSSGGNSVSNWNLHNSVHSALVRYE